IALAIAAGLTPAAQIAAQPLRYPPALTGLRGQHPGSFEVAHDLRDGTRFAMDGLPVEETYDLVVVGGGISGLAAAWFYRHAGPASASRWACSSRLPRGPARARPSPRRTTKAPTHRSTARASRRRPLSSNR